MTEHEQLPFDLDEQAVRDKVASMCRMLSRGNGAAQRVSICRRGFITLQWYILLCHGA